MAAYKEARRDGDEDARKLQQTWVVIKMENTKFLFRPLIADKATIPRKNIYLMFKHFRFVNKDVSESERCWQVDSVTNGQSQASQSYLCPFMLS